MPERRPIIGITPDVGETATRPGRPALPRYELKRAYSDAILAAGGLPIVLPYAPDDGVAAAAIALCAGLVVTGGAFDVPPEAYGDAPHRELGLLKPERTRAEERLLRAALAEDIPVLAVCGGMQLLAVAEGGTLIQHIPDEVPGALEHEQKDDPRKPSHAARIERGSALEGIVGAATISVNSTHHQAVRDPGRCRICAVAPDGVIEAIELPGRFALGVQWHPELLDGGEHRALYEALVRAARR